MNEDFNIINGTDAIDSLKEYVILLESNKHTFDDLNEIADIIEEAYKIIHLKFKKEEMAICNRLRTEEHSIKDLMYIITLFNIWIKNLERIKKNKVRN